MRGTVAALSTPVGDRPFGVSELISRQLPFTRRLGFPALSVLAFVLTLVYTEGTSIEIAEGVGLCPLLFLWILLCFAGVASRCGEERVAFGGRGNDVSDGASGTAHPRAGRAFGVRVRSRRRRDGFRTAEGPCPHRFPGGDRRFRLRDGVAGGQSTHKYATSYKIIDASGVGQGYVYKIRVKKINETGTGLADAK